MVGVLRNAEVVGLSRRLVGVWARCGGMKFGVLSLAGVLRNTESVGIIRRIIRRVGVPRKHLADISWRLVVDCRSSHYI